METNPEYISVEGPFILEAKHPQYVLYDNSGNAVVSVVMNDAVEAIRCILQSVGVCEQAKFFENLPSSEIPRFNFVDGEWVRMN